MKIHKFKIKSKHFRNFWLLTISKECDIIFYLEIFKEELGNQEIRLSKSFVVEKCVQKSMFIHEAFGYWEIQKIQT